MFAFGVLSPGRGEGHMLRRRPARGWGVIFMQILQWEHRGVGAATVCLHIQRWIYACGRDEGLPGRCNVTGVGTMVTKAANCTDVSCRIEDAFRGARTGADGFIQYSSTYGCW